MKKYFYLIILFLIVVSCSSFGRIAGNDFINLDDNKYVTENNDIQSGLNLKSIKWAATTVVVGNWHPLTLLSHMLDWRLFGGNASGHHIVSLLLHIGAVVLLFLFLNKTTKSIWPSAFAAALFAIHPLRVESVAWIAERKDVLSMFFGMACIYAYAFYTEKANVFRYLICLMLFAMALMAKPMMVTIPFLLLLLDYWPLERWQTVFASSDCKLKSSKMLIWEKLPFICLSVISCVLTFWAQSKDGAMEILYFLPFATRIPNAIVSYAAYLGKIFLPINLAVFYPYEYSLPLGKVLLSAVMLVFITAFVVYYTKKLPFLFTGWCWYLGTLIPVIGLVQVGKQAMADRYTYLPSIGIAIMIAWGIPLLFQNKKIRTTFLFPAAATILFILAVLSWQQCGYWGNSIPLFHHALQVTKNNYLAYNNRGTAYVERGQYQHAIEDFNKTLLLKPDYTMAYYNRGVAHVHLGRYQRAIEDYNQAINQKQHDAKAYNNRGGAYFKLGNNALGCRDVQKACELGGCIGLEWAKKNGYCR